METNVSVIELRRAHSALSFVAATVSHGLIDALRDAGVVNAWQANDIAALIARRLRHQGLLGTHTDLEIVEVFAQSFERRCLGGSAPQSPARVAE